MDLALDELKLLLDTLDIDFITYGRCLSIFITQRINQKHSQSAQLSRLFFQNSGSSNFENQIVDANNNSENSENKDVGENNKNNNNNKSDLFFDNIDMYLD